MMQITKNERHMKTNTPSKTYESPQTKVIMIEVEGTILQDSILEGVGHNPFEKGDDLAW